MLTPDRYIDVILSDGTELANAAERDLTARVPSCPQWSQRDLVAHLGGLYAWVERIIAGRLTTPPGRSGVLESPSEQLIGAYRRQLDGLVEALRNVDPGEPIWNWVGEHRALTWLRRMSGETAVHRWDAQMTTGRADPIAADVAADAIGELVEVFAPAAFEAWKSRIAARPVRSFHGLEGGSVGIETTDDARWVVVLGPDELGVSTQAEAHADLILRGSASELLLVLRERRAPSAVDISGDRSLQTALRRLYP